MRHRSRKFEYDSPQDVFLLTCGAVMSVCGAGIAITVARKPAFLGPEIGQWSSACQCLKWDLLRTLPAVTGIESLDLVGRPV
jgi:hypothetical protein